MKVPMRHPARVIYEVMPNPDPFRADEIMGALMAEGWIDEDCVRGMEPPNDRLRKVGYVCDDCKPPGASFRLNTDGDCPRNGEGDHASWTPVFMKALD